MEVPQNKKINYHDPATPLLDIFPMKTKTVIRKEICIPMFTEVLFTIDKIEAT